jgi:hypothetical protein
MDLRPIERWNTDGSEAGHVHPVHDLWNPAQPQPHAHAIRDVGREKQRDRDARARSVATINSLSMPELALAATSPHELGFTGLRSMIDRFLAIAANSRA